MRAYGLSTNLVVNRKAGGETFVVGGLGQNGTRWMRVLSRQAAQMLWFYLSRFLFPYKALTASAETAPMRGAGLPSITARLMIEQLDERNLELTGWSGGESWTASFTESEAYRLWMELDDLLQPPAIRRLAGLRGAAPPEQSTD